MLVRQRSNPLWGRSPMSNKHKGILFGSPVWTRFELLQTETQSARAGSTSFQANGVRVKPALSSRLGTQLCGAAMDGDEIDAAQQVPARRHCQETPAERDRARGVLNAP